MRTWKFAGAAFVALSVVALGGPASAQQTLADIVRSGNRESALAAITSPHVDVNQAAPDGSTALHWATYNIDHELVRALLDAGAEADVTSLYGSTPLTEAVKLGDIELVRMLLDAGADPDSPNQDNQTALMLAAALGLTDIAGLLVERGADVNAIETFRGQTPLMWAAGGNHPDIVDLLVANGADVSVRANHDDWPRQTTSEPRAQFRPYGGLTALLYATRSGCYRCAVAIVEAGADVNQPNPEGITPLLNALDNRNFDIAMYLLDQGANHMAWDWYGRTPIYLAVDMNSFEPRGFGFGGGQFGGGFAAFGGYAAGVEDRGDRPSYTAMDVVDRLLDTGVDVNHQLTQMRPNGPGRGRFADYMMRGGTGPLMIATLSYDIEAMEKLLAHGAEADLVNVFQITPLMAAAGMSGSGRGGPGGGDGDPQARAIRAIDLLLDAGADINARVLDSHTYTAKLDTYVQGRDNEGRTALFAAAEAGWDRVVEHLLSRGADPTVIDAAGNTALDAAKAPPPAGPGAGGGPSEESRQATVALLEAALGVSGSDDGPALAGDL